MKIKIIPTTVNLVEVTISNIEIFPNPTNGHISIDLTELKQPIELKITDLNGKVIQSRFYKENQLIDLNFEGAAGTYLLILESGNNKSATRLIKK